MKTMSRIFILLFICFLFFSSPASAAFEDYYRLDVFVFMDSSNSMKGTDPSGLRYQGFEDLTGQLETGDRIGLFQFGAGSKVVFPLTEITGDVTKKELDKDKIPRENLVYTDVKDVLEKGYQEMERAYDSEHLPFFILFTDGDIQPSKEYDNKAFKQEYLTQLKAVAEKYKNRNWPVYVIDLDINGQPGDPKLKETSELTGGYMTHIKTPEAIQATFRDVLSSIRKKKAQEEQKIQGNADSAAILDIRVTSPDSGEYPLKNNLELHAEMTVNGRRVRPGDKDFKLSSFYAEVHEAGQKVVRVELLDGGDVARGDMKEGDGIYSAFYKPEKEGIFSITIMAEGAYQGKPFQYKKEIKDLKAVPAGKVTLMLPSARQVLYPGRKNTLTVIATPESVRTERLEFALTGSSAIQLEPDAYYLFKGKNSLKLILDVPSSFSPGQTGELMLEVISSNNDTLLSPEEIKVFYSIETPKTGLYLLLAVIVITIAGIIFILTRNIRRKADIRSMWMRGSLSFWQEGNSEKQNIRLDSFKKEKIRLSVNFDDHPDQLLVLGAPIDIELYMGKDENEIRYYITGGIDNILYIGETPHKTLRLEHELTFRIHDYLFRYDNPKLVSRKQAGTNVLQKYDI